MHEMYKKLLEVQGEAIGVTGECSFINSSYANREASAFVASTLTDVLADRKELENLYHESIILDLFHNLDEMKFYSEVNVDSSRRMITTNNDCLSLVQIIIRDEIYINAYFRSSDVHGALPIDLEFLVNIPGRFIDFLELRKDLHHYTDITTEYLDELSRKRVNFKVMFGSLHESSGY